MRTERRGPVTVLVCCRAPGPIDAGHNSVSHCQCADCLAERHALAVGPVQRDLFAALAETAP